MSGCLQICEVLANMLACLYTCTSVYYSVCLFIIIGKRGKEAHCAEWDHLILTTFPQSADEDINGHESALDLLFREYDGETQRKTDRYVAPKGVTFYVVQ